MIPKLAAHLSGAVGALLTAAFLVGLAVPPTRTFPDSLLTAFHTFFVGVIRDREGFPGRHDPAWIEKAEPGDVLFVSRGRVPWGEWSHAAMVVRAPADAVWAPPGSLAVMDASIHDGMYFAPVEKYLEHTHVVVRRASHDPEVRRRMAQAAIQHRSRIFAGVARPGSPYSNCTTSVITSLEAVGLDPGLSGWQTPDELFRSSVWVD